MRRNWQNLIKSFVYAFDLCFFAKTKASQWLLWLLPWRALNKALLAARPRLSNKDLYLILIYDPFCRTCAPAGRTMGCKAWKSGRKPPATSSRGHRARRDGGTRLFNRLIHNLGSRAGKGWLDTKKVVSISIIIVTTWPQTSSSFLPNKAKQYHILNPTCLKNIQNSRSLQ